MLLSGIPVVVTMYAALIAKINDPFFTDILYYDARFILILLTIVPCLVFDLKEYNLLYGSLIFILIGLILFDPIHELLNVGYYQRGFSSKSYFYINYVAVISFVGITAGCFTLKFFIEKYEAATQLFENDLIKKNVDLSEALKNIETQNEEIVSQSEELLASQEKLVEANKLIAQQNSDLESKIKEASSELYRTNQELVKRNSDLSQFSYTISHNLRGPIARLLGLANIATFNQNIVEDHEAMNVIDHIRTSAHDLDNVIKDLVAIVDTQSIVHQNLKWLSFDEEWHDVKKLLNLTKDFDSKHLDVNFSSALSIKSFKPLLNSIFYNLVSNAIKYRSHDRDLHVSIRTSEDPDYWVLQVADNGLGIDMALYGKDLFKMYKRFHENHEGKGLGLYLVKLQVESLDGFIEVTSEVDIGTTFTIYFRKGEGSV